MTAERSPQPGDRVTVAGLAPFTITHVSRRYVRGITDDGTPIADTGAGLIDNEGLWTS